MRKEEKSESVCLGSYRDESGGASNEAEALLELDIPAGDAEEGVEVDVVRIGLAPRERLRRLWSREWRGQSVTCSKGQTYSNVIKPSNG